MRQLFNAAGLRQKRADFVQRLQPHALRLDVPGFGLDLRFKPFVHGIKLAGHAVETGGDLAKFVLGIDGNAGRKFSGLDPAQPLMQAAQGADDIQITRVEHDNRATDGQGHHGELEQVENGGQA